MPACKEFRWRRRDEVLVRLIESIRVADDLEPVANAGVPVAGIELCAYRFARAPLPVA